MIEVINDRLSEQIIVSEDLLLSNIQSSALGQDSVHSFLVCTFVAAGLPFFCNTSNSIGSLAEPVVMTAAAPPFSVPSSQDPPV